VKATDPVSRSKSKEKEEMAVRSYAQAIVSTKLADEKLWTWANASTVVRTAIGLFRLEWMILNHFFSNQLLRLPTFSLSYSYAVDRAAWWPEWAQPRFFNAGMVTMLPLGAGSIWAVAPILMALYGVRLYLAIRRYRLPPAER